MSGRETAKKNVGFRGVWGRGTKFYAFRRKSYFFWSIILNDPTIKSLVSCGGPVVSPLLSQAGGGGGDRESFLYAAGAKWPQNASFRT